VSKKGNGHDPEDEVLEVAEGRSAADLATRNSQLATFRIRETVRWGDVDQAGIIFYGSYVRFVEIAETELFRAAGVPYSRLFEEFDLWLPRVQLHLEFRSPARLDDVLEVEAWVGRIGRTSLRLEFAVRRVDDGGPGTLTADGYIVMVAIDRQSMRPVPLPEGLVAALGRYSAGPREQ
jgi:YbgC/YbaW family acyl-CoA thioester hydrolase